MPTGIRRDLRTLPKAHLHLHLSACMRQSLLRELLEREGLAGPEPGDGTFGKFLNSMLAVASVIRTAEDVVRLFREMAEDAAADSVVWLEPATALRPGLATQLGLEADAEALLELMLEAAFAATKAAGVGIGLMVSANRTRSSDEAVALARIAARYAGRGVVSFGLADDETRGPAERFAEAFSIARAAGLLSTPHGGELCGPDSVRAAIDVLGARRVQHGVRAVEDATLLKRLVDEDVCLDVCPTSNAELGVVRSLEDHPLLALLEAGVPVSLNADCPVIFGCGLLNEYELARDVFGLDDVALARIGAASIRASGAPAHIREAALAGVDAWLG